MVATQLAWNVRHTPNWEHFPQKGSNEVILEQSLLLEILFVFFFLLPVGPSRPPG